MGGNAATSAGTRARLGVRAGQLGRGTLAQIRGGRQGPGGRRGAARLGREDLVRRSIRNRARRGAGAPRAGQNRAGVARLRARRG